MNRLKGVRHKKVVLSSAAEKSIRALCSVISKTFHIFGIQASRIFEKINNLKFNDENTEMFYRYPSKWFA